jgi:cytochrome c oxidase subunit 1
MGLGYLLPFCYLLWSLKYGKPAGPNPWRATGLEWQVDSPPTTFNFDRIPIVTHGPYAYSPEADELLDAQADMERAQLEFALTQKQLEASHVDEQEEVAGGV